MDGQECSGGGGDDDDDGDKAGDGSEHRNHDDDDDSDHELFSGDEHPQASPTILRNRATSSTTSSLFSPLKSVQGFICVLLVHTYVIDDVMLMQESVTARKRV